MNWTEYLWVAIPCGLVTSFDVGLSNLSLVTISITFYTMVKASTPVFVLAWAYVFGIERITINLLIVVAIIAAGEFLTVLGEVEFQLSGFILCLLASVMSGARWTLVQLKLQTLDPPLKTTFAAMKMLAPSMFVSMFIISLCLERPWNKFKNLDGGQILHILSLGSVGASFAILMILCEFYLIMYSSAVILMIGGVLKEMVTIVMGVTFFHDELNGINLAGCFVVFLGIVYYKVTFHLDKQKHGSDKPPHLRGQQRQYRAVQADERDDSLSRGDGSSENPSDDDGAGVNDSTLTQRHRSGEVHRDVDDRDNTNGHRRTASLRLSSSLSMEELPEMAMNGITPATASSSSSSKPSSTMETPNVVELRSRIGASGLRSRDGSPTTSSQGPPTALLV
jgi:solute carrier family 35 protein C2